MEIKEEIEINEENFNQYFKDVRISMPEKGDIIAQYTAVAEFVDGNEKKQIISLLTSTENKMEATAQVMRKLLFASEEDAYGIPRKMAEDLLSGMTEEEVAQKPYKYTLEMFFYTQPDNVPKDDPHWSSISVLNLQEFLDKKESPIQAKILSKEESEILNLELKNENDSSESGKDPICGDAGVVEVSEAK
jgi:hypothetical protein